MRKLLWMGLGVVTLYAALTSQAALPPVLPQPGGKEGVLVGSIVVLTQASSRGPCYWVDVRFRAVEGPAFDASFITAQQHRELFKRKDAKGDIFVLSLPAGKYEIYKARANCILDEDSEHEYVAQQLAFAFEVAPGKRTYLGEIAFSHSPLGTTTSSSFTGGEGASIMIRDQWDRDSRLFESYYPLIDWTETLMSELAGPLKRIADDDPLPRTLEFLIKEPIAPAASAKNLETACAREDAKACFDLGLHFWKDKGVVKSEIRATEHFEKACKGGVGQGCFNLGTFYMQGWGFVDGHVGHAAELFDKACKLGTAWGCLNLGKMYEEGSGGVYFSQDEKKAITLYQQACNQGLAESCFAMGMYYLKGQRTARDASRAVSLFEKSCAGGYRRACLARAQLKEHRKD